MGTDYHYCTASFNKFAMVRVSKATRLLSVNHTTKTIHQHLHHANESKEFVTLIVFSTKAKLILLFLFNGTTVLLPVSDGTKLFAEIFLENSFS